TRPHEHRRRRRGGATGARQLRAPDRHVRIRRDAGPCRAGAGRYRACLPNQLCQQNGYLHAGISTTIADSAGGYAALTLFEPGEDVLTSEFKMNFLAPADGERFVASGRVVKPGRRLCICQVEVRAYRDDEPTLCLIGLM